MTKLATGPMIGDLAFKAKERWAWQAAQYRDGDEVATDLSAALEKTLARARKAEWLRFHKSTAAYVYVQGKKYANPHKDWTDADWLAEARKELGK